MLVIENPDLCFMQTAIITVTNSCKHQLSMVLLERNDFILSNPLQKVNNPFAVVERNVLQTQTVLNISMLDSYWYCLVALLLSC